SSPRNWAGGVCFSCCDGGAGFLVARKSERVSVYYPVGSNDESPASCAAGDGAAGNKTNGDSSGDVAGVRPLVRAVSDYDQVKLSDSSCRQQSLNLSYDLRHVVLIRQSDHEELVALVETDHTVGKQPHTIEKWIATKQPTYRRACNRT
ncbi:MAG: hypothetical protein DMF69_08380, partial [Acidobacteria bacterium]